MSDYRILEFVWDKPTYMFEKISQYIKSNSDYDKNFECVVGGSVGRTEELIHNFMQSSYGSNLNLYQCATKGKRNYGLGLVEENNGKKFALLKKSFRDDLTTIGNEIKRLFGDFHLTDNYFERKGEHAEAKIFLGYDEFSRERKKLPEFENGKTDCRISNNDLSKIVNSIDRYGSTIRTSSEKTVFYEENGAIKLNLDFVPQSHSLLFGSNDRLRQFFPYSIIKIEGQPEYVRTAMMNLVSLGWKEDKLGNHNFKSGLFEEFLIPFPDLKQNIDIHNISYHQFIPTPLRR